ncbi:MAG: hypothetical protein QM740_00610 [Acidovorax sp.]
MQRISLSPKSRDQLSHALDLARQTVRINSEHDIHLASNLAVPLLPFDSAIHELRLMAKDDATLVSGLPIPDDADYQQAALVLAAVAAIARRGSPWNWVSQGGLFQLLEPKAGAPDNTNATPGEFLPHADDSALGPLSPEDIVLSGLKNVSGVRTGWVRGLELFEGAPRAFEQHARSKKWLLRAPLSLGLGEVWIGPVPLVHGERNVVPRIALATYAVRPADPNDRLGHAVIEFLRELAMDRMQWVALEPGTLLVLPNRYGLHAREATTSADRAAVRAYFNSDLRLHWKLASSPGESHRFDAAKAMRSLWPSHALPPKN